MQKSVIFVKKINMLYLKINKNIVMIEIIAIIQGNIEVLHIVCLKFSLLKKIPIVLNNESNYSYHLIIKELEEQFKKKFTCLGENTESA